MNIQQSKFKLINFLTLLALFTAYSCLTEKPIEIMPDRIILKTAQGHKLRTRLSVTPQQQSQGLSGISDQEFTSDEAMLFFNLTDDLRTFWMPDTYFNLDIFFLDKELRVIDIDRNVTHFKGREPFEKIPRAKPVVSRHVLELKANSEIAKKMKIGEKLIWSSNPSSQQIESKIRRDQ
jgi:uncharacterized membrane protein (UPF0127 family)